MRTHAFRLRPGEDLKQAIVAHAARGHVVAGYVLTCVGSLRRVALRLAGAEHRYAADGDFEIVSLVGTLGSGGVHLHLSASDDQGRTIGGHLTDGCIVRTTAEIVLADEDRFAFHREPDPETGYDELVVRELPLTD